MNKRVWIVLIVLAVAAGGGLVWWRISQTAYTDYLDFNQAVTRQNVIDARNKAANGGKLNPNFKLSDTDKNQIIPDHVFGKTGSKVVVIQYEDFACSACNALAATASKIMNDYQDRVLFVFRNFSIGSYTSKISQVAAEAAFVLGGEEAFWKMHDYLFNSQICYESRDPASKKTCQAGIESYAQQLGFDVTKFDQLLAEYTTNGISDKLDRDRALGIRAGVNATPTWFVNGQPIGVHSMTDSGIRQAIDKALQAAGQTAK